MAKDDEVRIIFKKIGPGWADCTINIGAAAFTMTSISYTTDALGDLIRAALQIAAGGQQAWCSFDREPPEWRLLLDRDIDPELLFVRVLEFPDSYMQRAPEEGQLCFSSDCSADRFARAVCSAAAAVLSEKGEDGYSEWWGLPFPERALSSLKATLAA